MIRAAVLLVLLFAAAGCKGEPAPPRGDAFGGYAIDGLGEPTKRLEKDDFHSFEWSNGVFVELRPDPYRGKQDMLAEKDMYEVEYMTEGPDGWLVEFQRDATGGFLVLRSIAQGSPALLATCRAREAELARRACDAVRRP